MHVSIDSTLSPPHSPAASPAPSSNGVIFPHCIPRCPFFGPAIGSDSILAMTWTNRKSQELMVYTAIGSVTGSHKYLMKKHT